MVICIVLPGVWYANRSVSPPKGGVGEPAIATHEAIVPAAAKQELVEMDRELSQLNRQIASLQRKDRSRKANLKTAALRKATPPTKSDFSDPIEEGALVMLAAAEKAAQKDGKEAGLCVYRRLVEIFPDSRSAEIAPRTHVEPRLLKRRGVMEWKSGIGSILLAALAAIPVVSKPQDDKDRKRDLIQKQLADVRSEQQVVSKQLLELIEKHGTLVMSRERVLQEMGQLEEQAWNATLAQEETQIRSEVLHERLKRAVAEAKEADSKDEVGTLLEKKLTIATAKKNRVELLLKNGTAPTAELEDAEGLVADAQLALAQHREEKKQSPEADEIKAISRELAEMESDAVVKRKLGELHAKRAEELKASLMKTAEYNDLERTEESLNRRREHWEQRLLDLETQDFEAPAKDEKEGQEEKEDK